MSVRLHVCGCMSRPNWTARVCIAGLKYSMPVSHIRFIILNNSKVVLSCWCETFSLS